MKVVAKYVIELGIDIQASKKLHKNILSLFCLLLFIPCLFLFNGIWYLLNMQSVLCACHNSPLINPYWNIREHHHTKYILETFYNKRERY